MATPPHESPGSRTRAGRTFKHATSRSQDSQDSLDGGPVRPVHSRSRSRPDIRPDLDRKDMLSRSGNKPEGRDQGMFTLDIFSQGNFQVDEQISKLAEPVLNPADPAMLQLIASSASGKMKNESLAKIERLLKRFERAETELVKMQKNVDQRVVQMQANVAREQESFEEGVVALEAGLQETQASFQALDNKMTQVGQAATKIGDRLQTSDMFRRRAYEAIDMIQFLQEFSMVEDLSELSNIFQDDQQLAEAAALTRQMVALTAELTSANQRAGLVDEGTKKSSAPLQQGTIEYAAEKLERYRNKLEGRVIMRFDAAVAPPSNLEAMAHAARIMAEFRRGEAALVQRYISTRPMFLESHVRPVYSQLPDGDPTAALTAIRALTEMYKGILVTVKEEALVMEQVFPNPDDAMATFVQRVFEQRVQEALDAMLVLPQRVTAEGMQNYLKLLTEGYKKTSALANRLQGIVSPTCNVNDLARSVFADILGDYPHLELRWLQALFEKRAAKSRALSLEKVAEFCAWNSESAERCGVLSPEGQVATNVRQLFHSSTVQRASTGCLLEQVATHVIGGLYVALELAKVNCELPFACAPSQRAGISRAAYAVAAEGVGKVLEAINLASNIIKMLQQHYVKVIEPAVEAHPQEQTSCSTGLAALIRAVEDRALATLQSGITVFFVQVGKTLGAEQKTRDFLPADDGNLRLDLPTDACLLATALLSAAVKVAQQNLRGANFAAFTAELARRMHATLLTHMQRYTFSGTGAVRWKRDVTEYFDFVRGLKTLSAVEKRFEELQALVNVLVLPPESLLGLVDGSLRLSHTQALKFIKLREDYKSARVDGQTLAAVFASD